MRQPDKNGVMKRKHDYLLPEPSSQRTSMTGRKLFSPNWRESYSHKDNREFIQTLTETVKALPVRLSKSAYNRN
jgi:hypothetical protein